MFSNNISVISSATYSLNIEAADLATEFASHYHAQVSTDQSLMALSSFKGFLRPNRKLISSFLQVNFKNYYPITQISNNDRRIIAACLDFPNQ